ncbi:MAG: F0F1 ATP synthase subunit gamma [Clostridia bacterium]|nr:F0F1 ATP synthase subunit gamma [Clostridia bacterium]
MASLLELKKHLHSIRTTGQLAGAMKTVSAAKLSRLNGALQNFSGYQSLCTAMKERFGHDLSDMYPCRNPDAPRCFVVLGANRGLCGGYNMELYSHAESVLREASGSYLLIVTGRHAVNHFREAGYSIYKEHILPETLHYEDCMPLLGELLELYGSGTVSSVELLYQRFVNMLTQTPDTHRLLPLAAAGTDGAAPETLYVPDRETVLRSAAATCVNADFYTHILEAGAGNQAATLIAMRSAFDNAEASAATLESAISRQRQSEVTSSVIETAGGYTGD